MLLLYIEKMFKIKTKTVFKGPQALIIHLSLMKTRLCRRQAPFTPHGGLRGPRKAGLGKGSQGARVRGSLYDRSQRGLFMAGARGVSV